MTWLIGVDEAGYGPNLGPLVIGATAWKLPAGTDASAVDLYHLLSDAVSQTAGNARLPIADSKLLYKPGGGLKHLERALFAAFREGACDSFSQLVAHLQADAAGTRLALPWHEGFDPSVPVNLDEETVQRDAAQLDACLSRSRMNRPAVRARLVFPEEFNRLTELHDSKGAALSHVTIGLVRTLYDELGAPAVCVLDKHGGRNRYGGLLQDHFPEFLPEIVRESRAESYYRWGEAERQVTFTFRSKGEGCLQTALASMAAKYLRELSMLALNRYWKRLVPQLKPTAGYPMDAKRFRSDIAHAQRKLGVADRVLWRVK